MLEHSGTFEGGVAEASWSVVPGSGTGELRGLRGEGVLRLRGRPALPHHPRLRLGVNERTAKEIPL